ncbi:hypothetical protein ACQKIE_18200 [Luteibacter sp. NPDC031894]|uniref:hypothetical protein n=1 Tax=Luteibacter sp. NPDC031894 TaxID=3390572 RepID=UPI003D0512AF
MQVKPASTMPSFPAAREVGYSREMSPHKVPPISSSLASKGIDFSRITPRQIQSLCDELIFTGGEQEFDDASALGNSLPSGIFERAPDTPINLTGQIEGMIEFDRNNGFDLLATFYSGLLDRMKLMEARSVHISVKA